MFGDRNAHLLQGYTDLCLWTLRSCEPDHKNLTAKGKQIFNVGNQCLSLRDDPKFILCQWTGVRMMTNSSQDIQLMGHAQNCQSLNHIPVWRWYMSCFPSIALWNMVDVSFFGLLSQITVCIQSWEDWWLRLYLNCDHPQAVFVSDLYRKRLNVYFWLDSKPHYGGSILHELSRQAACVCVPAKRQTKINC